MCMQLNAARSRVACSSIKVKTRRRIRFGTTSAANQSRALILSFSAAGIMFVWLYFGFIVRSCDDRLNQMHRNISSVPWGYESFQCLAFNKQCDCRMPLNRTHVLNPCVTRLRFHIMKILPLMSLLLHPFALREFFTLDPDYNRFFIRMAWGVSPFVYAAIVIVMFTDHCYHICLMASIYGSTILLFVFGLHELLENRIVARKEDRTVPISELPQK